MAVPPLHPKQQLCFLSCATSSTAAPQVTGNRSAAYRGNMLQRERERERGGREQREKERQRESSAFLEEKGS